MEAGGVVDPFSDSGEDVSGARPGSGTGEERLFMLEGLEEALGLGVVMRIPGSRHRAAEPGRFEDLAVPPGGSMPRLPSASVRGNGHPALPRSGGQRLLLRDGVEILSDLGMRTDRPAEFPDPGRGTDGQLPLHRGLVVNYEKLMSGSA